MDNTGPATTTMFERALGAGLGIFDFVTDSVPTPVDKPTKGTKERNGSYKPNKKSKRPRNRRDN